MPPLPVSPGLRALTPWYTPALARLFHCSYTHVHILDTPHASQLTLHYLVPACAQG